MDVGDNMPCHFFLRSQLRSMFFSRAGVHIHIVLNILGGCKMFMKCDLPLSMLTTLVLKHKVTPTMPTFGVGVYDGCFTFIINVSSYVN